MKIAKITYSDKSYGIILKNLIETKKKYCYSNNIDFFYEEVNLEYRYSWYKIFLYKKYFSMGYDTVWISDCDSFILNSDYEIRNVINEFSYGGICACMKNRDFLLLGSAILKNVPEILNIINYTIENFNRYQKTRNFFAEEEVFNLFKPKILIDNNINCIYNHHEIEFPFVMHFAGIGNPFSIKKLHEETLNRKKYSS